ncbi:MAG: RNA-directed DNA polymerase [Paludibaculum sp.]
MAGGSGIYSGKQIGIVHMFFLTSNELDNALEAINYHGFSTMIPPPPEWGVVNDNWLAIKGAIEKIDLDTYDPILPLKIFGPKSRANIRIMHMLHPQDLLIYTALVLIAKDDIERNRIPTGAKRVFSYRVDAGCPKKIYGTKSSHEKYREQLDIKSQARAVKFVGIADIADFYPRIYQHRLENVIESVARSQRTRDVARVLVRKLIASLMGGNSYGIPVGPYASRLLGEAVLIDVDAALQNHRVNFVRWVDDYNIFCSSEYDCQSALFALGESLYNKHGLTLQSAKTKILPVQSYRSDVLLRYAEKLTGRDAVVSMLRGLSVGYDPTDEMEPLDETSIQEALAVLQSTDLREMLETSLSDTALVDFEAVVYALKKLPRIPGVPISLKRSILDLVVDNARLLYPVAEQLAKYVLSFPTLTRAERNRIAVKLLRPLKSKFNVPPDYYAMWVLHVFASSSDWSHAGDIASLYASSTSEVVKRYATLAISSCGTRAEAVGIKDAYVGASPLHRLGILFASRKLGGDERKHWRQSISVKGIIEKLV